MFGFAPESISNSNMRLSDLPLKNQQESSIVVFMYSTGLPKGMTGTLASGSVFKSLNGSSRQGIDMAAEEAAKQYWRVLPCQIPYLPWHGIESVDAWAQGSDGLGKHWHNGPFRGKRNIQPLADALEVVVISP